MGERGSLTWPEAAAPSFEPGSGRRQVRTGPRGAGLGRRELRRRGCLLPDCGRVRSPSERVPRGGAGRARAKRRSVNLDSFELETLVVHDVPQPDEDREDLILTEAEVPLDAQLRGYFERKIKQSLRNRGLEVVADATGAAAVRDGVASVLAEPAELVVVSQAFARHLDQSQTKRNPAGLLAV